MIPVEYRELGNSVRLPELDTVILRVLYRYQEKKAETVLFVKLMRSWYLSSHMTESKHCCLSEKEKPLKAGAVCLIRFPFSE